MNNEMPIANSQLWTRLSIVAAIAIALYIILRSRNKQVQAVTLIPTGAEKYDWYDDEAEDYDEEEYDSDDSDEEEYDSDDSDEEEEFDSDDSDEEEEFVPSDVNGNTVLL